MLVGAGCQGHELALPPLNQPTQKQEFPNFLLSVGSNCVLIKGALCTFQARGTCFVFLSPAVAWMLENSVPLPRLIYMKEVEVSISEWGGGRGNKNFVQAPVQT